MQFIGVLATISSTVVGGVRRSPRAAGNLNWSGQDSAYWRLDLQVRPEDLLDY
jgi:hypothetical protein